MKKLNKNIYITENNFERLERLLAVLKSSPNIEQLKSEMERAIVVPADKIQPYVVTMNSHVIFREIDTGHEEEVTLVYPSDSDVDARRISILTPVGSALLGLSVGDKIEWPLPSGKNRIYKVISVIYQPEAHGQYD